ncbi:hypothetical protein DQ04_01241150 [Trypanosoma grayi]|uniref:hypothetical protein n=1 Tax=Trypanosoma grayi TaxID=71804 RepID=UPI0004F43E75|nr:hypothetical protein DQ04_01241150 [Trypanosoma grayi]KEG13060.1 hypothetical protein DQ04_01241150 [Trypanosoma grayi]
MLRRLCTPRGGSALLLPSCARQWMGGSGAASRGAVHSSLTNVVRRAALPSRRTAAAVPLTKSAAKRSDARNASSTRAAKTVAAKQVTRRQAARENSSSRSSSGGRSAKPTTGTSPRVKAGGCGGKGRVSKGHPHAHAVQKMKYNKRVAAIAKLWRMQKKKVPRPPASSLSPPSSLNR